MNEQRLIDANDLLDYIKILCRKYYVNWDETKVVAVINQAKTVDAAPVVHGHWIETIENGHMKRVASCCDTDFTKLTTWLIPNYCPNCGAKMDEVK